MIIILIIYLKLCKKSKKVKENQIFIEKYLNSKIIK